MPNYMLKSLTFDGSRLNRFFAILAMASIHNFLLGWNFVTCDGANPIAQFSQLLIQFSLPLDQRIKISAGRKIGFIKLQLLIHLVQTGIHPSGKFIAGKGTIALIGAVGGARETASRGQFSRSRLSCCGCRDRDR